MNGSPVSPRPEARRSRTPLGWPLLAPGLIWLLLLFVLPLAGLLPLSFSLPVDRFGLAVRFAWHGANYTTALRDHGEVLLRSCGYALAATLLALALSLPLAWLIRFRGGRWKPLLLGLVVLPFFTSYLVRTIAWSTLLADRGPVLALLHRLPGLGELRLLNTGWAVIGGLAYNALPFLVLPLVVSLERIEPALLEAAADLHAGPLERLRRVVLPLALPGVISCGLLSLIPAIGDLVNARFLGGPNDRMIGNVVESLMLVQMQLPRAAALALLLMLLLAAPSLLLLLRHGRDGALLP
jgi:spermidine/putrescine transport system permease protein